MGREQGIVGELGAVSHLLCIVDFFYQREYIFAERRSFHYTMEVEFIPG